MGRKAWRVGFSHIAVMCAALVLALCTSPVIPQEIPFAPDVPGSLDPDDTPAPTVPDVIGDRLETAVWRLGNRDLEGDVRESPLHDPDAVVVGQDPPGGARPPWDRIVRLWLAREQRLIEVPYVIGERLGDAEHIIAERELRPEVVGGEAPPDARVIRQEPEPGAQTEPGHPVRVWVEDWVMVPDLVGLPVRQAARELRAQGLGMELARESIGPDDEILFQEPEAGARVAPGSIVFLDVGRSAALVHVPGVIDLHRDAAFLEIEEARLVPRVSPASEHDHGRVIRQQPVSGAQARLGDPVLLWLFAHPRRQCGPPCVALIVLVPITVLGLGTWLWLRGSGRAEPNGRNDKRGLERVAFEDHIGELRTRLEGPLAIGTEIRLEPVPDIDGHQTLDAPGALVTGWEELP